MKEADKSKFIKCFQNVAHYYFIRNGEFRLFEDNPFNSFIEVIDPVVAKFDYYNFDIFVSCVEYYISNLLTKKDYYIWADLETLLNYIKQEFLINKKEHFLVFPLERSKITNDICFDDFYFLKRREFTLLCDKISEVTLINKQDVNKMLNHTCKSRSPHFTDSDILIIKVEEQTDNVKYFSYWYAQYAVYFLRILFFTEGHTQSIFQKVGSNIYPPNKHVQILSKKIDNCGHGTNYEADFSCPIDLDFLNKKQTQEKFVKLVDIFLRKKSKDDLIIKFENALRLFMKGYYYRKIHNDDTVALILYIASLESMFKDRIGDIRIRLSVTISKLLDMDVAKLISEMYTNRNDFMHAGRRYRDDKDKLNKLENICFALFMKCLDLDTIIPNNSSRLKSWEDYLDAIFEIHIFGSVV
jgi:hypothetical protein